jgi:hypothetical protein
VTCCKEGCNSTGTSCKCAEGEKECGKNCCKDGCHPDYSEVCCVKCENECCFSGCNSEKTGCVQGDGACASALDTCRSSGCDDCRVGGISGPYGTPDGKTMFECTVYSRDIEHDFDVPITGTIEY